MPFIVTSRGPIQQPEGSPFSEALMRAGEKLGQGFLNARKLKQQAAEEKRAERRLQVEEQRAKASLLREANLAAARKQKEQQEITERQEAERGFVEPQQVADASIAMRAAQRTTGGVLGPYGMLNAQVLGAGAQSFADTKKRLAQKVELAKRMSPAGARAYLEKEAEKEARATIARGFQDEKKALDDAVRDGVIDEGTTKEIAKLLQASIKQGKAPGAVHEQLARFYDMNRQLRLRAEGWEQADQQAQGILDGFRQLIAQAPDGVDAVTGEDARAALTERLGAARAEWARTEYPSFRMKTDSAASLAGLQKLLFEAQAAGAPQQFVAEDVAQRRSQQIEQHFGPGYQQREAAEREANRARMGGGNVPRGTSPSVQETLPGKSGARTAAGGGSEPSRVPAQERQRQQLRGLVHDAAGEALRAGSPEKRKTAMKGLLERVARELGLDPTAPEVLAVVREELSGVFAAGGGPQAQPAGTR